MAKQAKLNPRKTLLAKLSGMSVAELQAFVADGKKQLLGERFGRLAQKTAKVGAYRQTRRDIARAYTVLAQKQGTKE